MSNNTKLFLAVIIMALVIGGITARSFFPKVIKETETITNTIHEVDSLEVKRQKGKIDSLQKLLDLKPKVIYEEIIVNGETQIDSQTVYPVGYKDIIHEEDWEEVFDNKDRDNDTLSFTIKDSVRVIAYQDTTGKPYLGYEYFYSWVENLKLSIAPQIYEREYVKKFSFFIDGGFGLTQREVILNNALIKEYSLSFSVDAGIVLENKWLIIPSYSHNKYCTTYGIKVGTYLFGFGKTQR